MSEERVRDSQNGQEEVEPSTSSSSVSCNTVVQRSLDVNLNNAGLEGVDDAQEDAAEEEEEGEEENIASLQRRLYENDADEEFRQHDLDSTFTALIALTLKPSLTGEFAREANGHLKDVALSDVQMGRSIFVLHRYIPHPDTDEYQYFITSGQYRTSQTANYLGKWICKDIDDYQERLSSKRISKEFQDQLQCGLYERFPQTSMWQLFANGTPGEAIYRPADNPLRGKGMFYRVRFRILKAQAPRALANQVLDRLSYLTMKHEANKCVCYEVCSSRDTIDQPRTILEFAGWNTIEDFMNHQDKSSYVQQSKAIDNLCESIDTSFWTRLPSGLHKSMVDVPLPSDVPGLVQENLSF